MEDWQKDWFAMLSTATDEVEQFFQTVTEVVEEVTEEVGEVVEAVVTQMQDAMSTHFEQYFQQLTEPIIEIYVDFEEYTFTEETDFLLNPKIEPTLQRHSACIGCRHYHGRVYNGNLLICGMHPYGWEGETCPDWEKVD